MLDDVCCEEEMNKTHDLLVKELTDRQHKMVTDRVPADAKTILDLMTRKKHPQGKVLLIGGGIANFTNVRATFEGIVSAIRKSVDKLKKAKIKIYVRRGGPNEKQGLELMKQVGIETGIPIEVYDRYTHMTRVVDLIKQAEEAGGT